MTSAFVTTLSETRHGALLGELDQELSDLVEEVAATGQKGTLTLTLAVEAAGEGKVELTPTVKATRPKPKPAKAIFYVTPGGGLSRRDPDQPVLPEMEAVR